MGCSTRDRSFRSNRKTRMPNKLNDCCNNMINLSSVQSFNYPIPGNSREACDQNSHPKFEETAWRYCTQDQLEELLLKNLEFLYNEAISRLMSLGYEQELALKAILRNVHCYGSLDILSNILQNAITHINSMSNNKSNSNSDDQDLGFVDLRQLAEYSLAGMIGLLRQVRPHLSKGDAMWCLLMSNLHVGRANAMEIPLSHGCGSRGHDFCKYDRSLAFGSDDNMVPNALSLDGSMATFSPVDMGDIDCPKRFSLSPSLRSLLKRNVAIFAAGFRASVQSQDHPRAYPCSLSSNGNGTSMLAVGSEISQDEKLEETQGLDVINTLLGSFSNLTIDEESTGGTDQRNEVILNLMNQVKDLEGQVKERKEWAHQKALQAAKKLSNDLTELKILRMERDETLRLKKGKQALEDSTMKRLSEMENALKKASGQVDRANAAVRHLETENAEIKAEMEASKLSASESVTACLEVAKREKRSLKKILAWEKQKVKLQEEVFVEKENISKLQHELSIVKESIKTTEVKWKQEIKLKEEAFAKVEEERRAKEAVEIRAKRKQESLRHKVEIDFERYRDDIKRLGEELSRLKTSAEMKQLVSQNTELIRSSDMAKLPKEINSKLLHQLEKLDEPSEKVVRHDRECIMCMKEEVSVVFLPCAHQVLCASCNDHHFRRARANCPCCRVKIDKRVRVFGAAS